MAAPTSFASGLSRALDRGEQRRQFDERLEYNERIRQEALEREARARQLAGIAEFLDAARTRADGTTISDEEVLRNNPQIADVFNQLVGRGGPYEKQFQTVPGVTRKFEGFSQGPEGRVAGRIAHVDDAGNVVSRGLQTVNGETGPNAQRVSGRNASEVLAPIDLYLAQNVPGYAGRLQQREERNLAAQRENQSRADLGTFAGIFSPDRIQGGQAVQPQGQGAGAISPDDLVAAARVASVGDVEAPLEIDAVTSAAPVVSPPTPGPTPAPTARPAPTPAPQATPRPTPAPSMQERKAAVAAGAERAAGNDPTARKGAKILAETPTAGGQATVDRAAKVHEESVLPKLQRAEDRGRRFVILKDNERRAIQRLIVNSGKMPDASTLQMLATGKVYLDSDAAKQLKTVQSGEWLATHDAAGNIVNRQRISGEGSEQANYLEGLQEIEGVLEYSAPGEENAPMRQEYLQMISQSPLGRTYASTEDGKAALAQSVPFWTAMKEYDRQNNNWTAKIDRWITGDYSRASKSLLAINEMRQLGFVPTKGSKFKWDDIGSGADKYLRNVAGPIEDFIRGAWGGASEAERANLSLAMRNSGVPWASLERPDVQRLMKGMQQTLEANPGAPLDLAIKASYTSNFEGQ